MHDGPEIETIRKAFENRLPYLEKLTFIFERRQQGRNLQKILEDFQMNMRQQLADIKIVAKREKNDGSNSIVFICGYNQDKERIMSIKKSLQEEIFGEI